jgi:hypothetical protein
MDRSDVISHNPGTVIIKHIDPWHGPGYLKDDLTFTPHRDQASKFYLLKSEQSEQADDKDGETEITNGDRITINIGNRNLSVHESKLSFENRDKIPGTSFLIVNGTNDNEPIVFNTPLFLISDKTTKQALKYVWNLDLNEILDAGIKSFKKNNCATLAIASYDNLPERDINTFKFFLEHNISSPPTVTNTLKQTVPMVPTTSNGVLFSDNYKGSIIIMILLIILIICALIGKY